MALVSDSNPSSKMTTDYVDDNMSVGAIEAMFRENAEEEPQNDLTPDQRVDLGLCPFCGIQLYQVKKSNQRKQDYGDMRPPPKEIIKVPLTIEGKVLRGQCLACSCTPSQTRKESPKESSSSLLTSLVMVDADKKQERGDTSSTSRSSSPSMDSPPEYSSSSANQLTATYKGEYNSYGERHGKGQMTWSNGDLYAGEFQNGMRHGHGAITFADGSEYVGEWFRNMMHGSGTRRFANGDCYMGPYTFGQRSGPEGRLYFANGDLYHGSFVDGKMSGFGRYYYSSGKRFEGTFHDGKRHGKGKTQRLNGTLEVFLYVADERVGLGVRWSPDRTRTWLLTPKAGACMGRIYLSAKAITVAEAVSQDYQIEEAANKLALDTTGECRSDKEGLTSKSNAVKLMTQKTSSEESMQ